MRSPSAPWLVSTSIGLAVGLVAVFATRLGGSGVLRAEVTASDLLLLRAGGPRLGRSAAAPGILLVQFDRRSAQSLGTVPSFDQDAKLYQALLAAGATLVADTRMVADGQAPEASPLTPLLDAMLAARPPGRLFRDVWLPGNWPPAQLERCRAVIAHNLINLHPMADVAFESRIYPLATRFDGGQESMPLRLARCALGLPQVSGGEVGAELARCGVAAYWKRTLSATTTAQRGGLVDAVVTSTGYGVGSLQLPWIPIRSNDPSVSPAGYWVNYALAPDRLERASYIDAARPAFAARARGKMVLIGYDAAIDPMSDTYGVPTSSDRAAADEVVAAAVQTVVSRGVMRATPPWVVWTTAVLLALAAAMVGGLTRVGAAAAIVLGGAAAYLVVAALAARFGWLADVVVAPAAGLSGGGLAAAFRYGREARHKSRIVDLFGRYVPKAVVAQLIQQRAADALALGGVNRDVSVLFADVRGFTTYAERAAPEEVLRQLNSLLKVMVDCTFAHDGTIDKFIGDAILVLFNAPLDQPDHALRAARAAVAIQRGLEDHGSGLSVGIGIHRGEAIVGRVGTAERMAYTAVGRTVNVASRLCGLAGRRQIVVSDAVARAIAGEFALDPQPPVQVKGVDEPLATSLLVGPLAAVEASRDAP